jgi:hypothetical protein
MIRLTPCRKPKVAVSVCAALFAASVVACSRPTISLQGVEVEIVAEVTAADIAAAEIRLAQLVESFESDHAEEILAWQRENEAIALDYQRRSERVRILKIEWDRLHDEWLEDERRGSYGLRRSSQEQRYQRQSRKAEIEDDAEMLGASTSLLGVGSVESPRVRDKPGPVLPTEVLTLASAKPHRKVAFKLTIVNETGEDVQAPVVCRERAEDGWIISERMLSIVTVEAGWRKKETITRRIDEALYEDWNHCLKSDAIELDWEPVPHEG